MKNRSTYLEALKTNIVNSVMLQIAFIFAIVCGIYFLFRWAIPSGDDKLIEQTQFYIQNVISCTLIANIVGVIRQKFKTDKLINEIK